MSQLKDFFSLILKTTILLLLLFTVVYTFLNRALVTIIENGAYIGGVIYTILILSLISIYFQDRKTKFKFRNIGLMSLLTLFLGLLFYSIIIVLEDLTLLQKNSYHYSYHNWKTPIIIFIVLVIGFSLFYFRLYFRSIYGLTEATVGVIIGVDRISKNGIELSESDFYFAILTASIYLIVRGLDNVHQGLTKEPLDPIAKKLKEMIE